MPAKKNTELAAFDASKFQIESIDTTLTADDISEELDGLGTIPLDRAKFPGSGGTQFEIADEDDEDETIAVNTIEGIIAYHHAMNSRWNKAYDGSQNPPVCSSLDGKTGIDVQTGEVINCATCSYNQFGSADAKSSSKACKNVHRLFIIRDGNPVPLILTIPPTSLRSFRNYVSKKLLLKGRKCNQVVTRISLKSDKSSSGVKYSKAAFEKLGDLNDSQKTEVASIGEFVKSIVAAETPIGPNDYNMEPAQTSETDIYNESYAPEPLPSVSCEERAYKPAPLTYSKPQVFDEQPRTITDKPQQAPPVSDDFDFIDVDSDDNPFA